MTYAHVNTYRPNANPILARMRDDDWDDPWGTTMAWGFGVAEVLHAMGEGVPREMGFRPGAYAHDPDVCPEEYPDAYVWEMLNSWEEVTVAEIQTAGRCLARFCDWLKAAGRDY